MPSTSRSTTRLYWPASAGSFALTAGVSNSGSARGLTQNTAHGVYVVAEDAVLNLQAREPSDRTESSVRSRSADEVLVPHTTLAATGARGRSATQATQASVCAG